MTKITVSSFERAEYLVLSGLTNSGQPLDHETCHRMFDLPADVGDVVSIHPEILSDLALATDIFKSEIAEHDRAINEQFFVEESEKLDNWGEDQRNTLRISLKKLDLQIDDLKKQSRQAANLPERLRIEKERKGLNSKRDDAWREYDEAAKGIERQKDEIIAEVERRLLQQVTDEVVFTIRWVLKDT